MKRFLVGAALAVMAGQSFAADSVRGYVRRDGTYVAPHMRSAPNDTRLDNYSTRGNVNPYTGQEGRVDPYSAPHPPSGFGTIEPIRPIEPIQPFGQQPRRRSIYDN